MIHKTLRRLDFSASNIKKIPAEVFEHTTLEELDLSYSLLTHINPELACLKNLKRLNLNFTELEEFPEVLLRLENLEELHIKSNKIGNIPTNWTSLDKLKILDLADGLLTTFPNYLANLPELEELDLSYQRVYEPGFVMTKSFPSLKKLKLMGNCQPQISAVQPSLEELNLANCDLSDISDLITYIPNITHLRINENKLTTLPDNFLELDKLTYLKLDFAALDETSLKILKSLPNITTIKIDNDHALSW